ncbi:MAG: hypothetical protein JWM21_162 [Acidobacteria bacterium]|nr:hypothetical protein [Acidobacteriota bacterium]
MHHAKAIKYGFVSLTLVLSVLLGSRLTAQAQEPDKAPRKTEAPAKKVPRGGRDPFAQYKGVPLAAAKKAIAGLPVLPPSLQERIDRYKAQKQAAMSAHVPAPKPTTALLLSEIQVMGITRTPRGYAAIVEATPIKLSYVIYPGEQLYDGQLVAIEDTRLVFRRDLLWTDGRHDRTVEMKALRQQSSAEALAAVKIAPVAKEGAESEKKSEDKPSPPDKP